MSETISIHQGKRASSFNSLVYKLEHSFSRYACFDTTTRLTFQSLVMVRLDPHPRRKAATVHIVSFDSAPHHHAIDDHKHDFTDQHAKMVHDFLGGTTDWAKFFRNGHLVPAFGLSLEEQTRGRDIPLGLRQTASQLIVAGFKLVAENTQDIGRFVGHQFVFMRGGDINGMIATITWNEQKPRT